MREFATRIVLVALFIGLSGRASLGNDDPSEEPEVQRPFSVKLIDSDGKPVEDAYVGVTAYFGGEGRTIPTLDESGWAYWHGAKSDILGIARLSSGADAGPIGVVARRAGL